MKIRLLLLSLLTVSAIALGRNVAPLARVTVSSEQSTVLGGKCLTDGLIGYDGRGEWACVGHVTDWGEMSLPHFELHWDHEYTIVRTLAAENHLEVIDLYDLLGDTWDAYILPDKLHPSAVGAGILARKIGRYLLGQSGVSSIVKLPVRVSTGEKVTAWVNSDIADKDFNYFIVDWGDGTWSYNGPYAPDITGEVYHSYERAGQYPVKACAVNLADGKRSEWSEERTIEVSGKKAVGTRIRHTTLIPGGFLFDAHYTLDLLEIRFPDRLPSFPSNVTVEYTTDGGQTWYMLPHYYYVLPNSEGYYRCVMNFPSPQGKTLSLPLDQVTADGIRFRGLENEDFPVEEMRVYGRKGSLFYTSREGCYDADISNMWTLFGTAKTEPMMYHSLRGARTNIEPFRSGSTMIASVEWQMWNGMKLDWSGYDEALAIHVKSMEDAVYGGDGWYYDAQAGKYVVDEEEYRTNPRDDGFIFATHRSPQHLNKQNHYTNNPSLIIAARDYVLSCADPDPFLASVNARGQVMIDKLRKAMDYMLKNLDGESGLLTIHDPRNDGTVRGVSSNYWDSLNFFGYISAYENVLFYQAVLAMADLEAFLGNDGEAERYHSLSEKVRRAFNDCFWDSVKGRYITSINIKGDRLDFGLTFVNFMAVAAGLASRQQAQSIYDWVDGRRIISSDTSTGEDIYHFKVSARSNTVAVQAVEEDGLHYWWYNGHPFNDVLPGHWGEFGLQMQNGGTIFYISHYDISGRAFLSGDLAGARLDTIVDEFHQDALRRDPRTRFGIYYQVSINGEFPESGLVPLSFVTDLVGIHPQVRGLEIQAHLPSDMIYAGVREYHYDGKVYQIEVNRKILSPVLKKKGDRYTVKVPADRTYYITRDSRIIANTTHP